MEFKFPYWSVNWRQWLVGFDWDSELDYFRPVKVTTVEFYFGPVAFGFDIEREHN